MRRIDQIEPFRVMQLLERARELETSGRRMIHMEIGEPDFPTPATVLEAARKRLATGENFYTPSTGLPALQQALSDWYKRTYGVSVASERILITPGTSGAFMMLYFALIEAGESVLLPDPGYPCQRNFIRLAGGQPLNAPVDPDTRYHLSAGHVDQHWRSSTRACVVISPGNPTGTLIPPPQFQALAQACRARDGWLISDEIYHGLTYGGDAVCALSIDDNSIVVNGFSKHWAMTGWRVGWVIVPEQLIDPCRRIMQNIFIAAPTLSQHAAIAALAAKEEVEAMRAQYDARRRYLLDELPKLGFDIVVEPQGAFYIYANIEKITDDSKAFCWRLLEEAGVALTPGEDFGTHESAKHLRLSYATGHSSLEEGIQRIATFLGKH